MNDDYTPTTEEVAKFYGVGWFAMDDPVEGDPIDNFTNWYEAEKRKWRAEAWDEGFDRGFYSGQLMSDADASESPIENPYRKEQP